MRCRDGSWISPVWGDASPKLAPVARGARPRIVVRTAVHRRLCESAGHPGPRRSLEMHQMSGSVDSTLRLLDLADEGRFPLMSHV